MMICESAQRDKQCLNLSLSVIFFSLQICNCLNEWYHSKTNDFCMNSLDRFQRFTWLNLNGIFANFYDTFQFKKQNTQFSTKTKFAFKGKMWAHSKKQKINGKYTLFLFVDFWTLKHILCIYINLLRS